MTHRAGGALRGIAAFLVALAALTSDARAQSDYYQEVPKEGRIYVFVTSDLQKAWEVSGEMGNKVVTRLGYGPGGETVFFENARAVELYNARHGTTEAPPPELPAEIKLPFNVQYRYPGLRLTFPKAEINLSHRIQFRYTHESFDDIQTPPPVLPTALEDKGSFRVRRMKTKFDGWIYSKELTYELQANWVAATNPTNLILEDANLDYDFTGGKRAFRLKFGQYKAGFGRQELTSSGSQQFVDRAITNTFAPARQIGLQAWGQFGSATVADMLEWRVGAYNGNGVNVSANENDEYLLATRVMLSPWGNVGYSEANLEAYDFRLSIAGEYLTNDMTVQPATGARTGTEVETAGVDVVLKALKSLSIFGAYYDGSVESAAGVETDREGYIGQIGWLITPKWELAARYAVLDPNTSVDNNDQTEWRGGVSWYMNRHNWKIQADYGETENEAAAATTNRTLSEIRVQAQLIF